MKTQAGLIASVLLSLALAADTAFAQEPQPLADAVRALAANPAAQPATRPARDSLLNGTLIGAAVGFGAGFATLAVANTNATDSGPVWDGENIGYYTGAGIIGAGIGAGIGALIDWLHKPATRPQRRPAAVALTPIHSRGRTGAMVSIRY